MRIAIMGSGGVGAYVGARLQSAGEEVVFIARGAHLQALQQNGLRIESPDVPLYLDKVTAVEDAAGCGPFDLIVVAVKLWDTDTAARTLNTLVRPDTRVVTLQNGIDSVGLISRRLGSAPVLGGVIYLSAVIDRPGVIRSPGGFHRIVVDGNRGDSVIAQFHAACNRVVGLEAEITDNVAVTIWEKFITLTALSGATTLLRASMGQILANPETRIFQLQLIDEAIAVGRAAGVATRDNLKDEIVEKLAAMPYSFRSSMAEDLERGKPLELQWLSGRLHGLGLQYGVATPAHSAVYRALILYEKGNPA